MICGLTYDVSTPWVSRKAQTTLQRNCQPHRGDIFVEPVETDSKLRQERHHGEYAAPDGAEFDCGVWFYKYVAPTALTGCDYEPETIFDFALRLPRGSDRAGRTFLGRKERRRKRGHQKGMGVVECAVPAVSPHRQHPLRRRVRHQFVPHPHAGGAHRSKTSVRYFFSRAKTAGSTTAR